MKDSEKYSILKSLLVQALPCVIFSGAMSFDEEFKSKMEILRNSIEEQLK